DVAVKMQVEEARSWASPPIRAGSQYQNNLSPSGRCPSRKGVPGWRRYWPVGSGEVRPDSICEEACRPAGGRVWAWCNGRNGYDPSCIKGQPISDRRARESCGVYLDVRSCVAAKATDFPL